MLLDKWIKNPLLAKIVFAFILLVTVLFVGLGYLTTVILIVGSIILLLRPDEDDNTINSGSDLIGLFVVLIIPGVIGVLIDVYIQDSFRFKSTSESEGARRDCYQVELIQTTNGTFTYGFLLNIYPKLQIFSKKLPPDKISLLKNVSQECLAVEKRKKELKEEEIRNAWFVTHKYRAHGADSLFIQKNRITNDLRGHPNNWFRFNDSTISRIVENDSVIWTQDIHYRDYYLYFADGDSSFVGRYSPSYSNMIKASEDADVKLKSTCREYATSLLKKFSHLEFEACIKNTTQKGISVEENEFCGMAKLKFRKSSNGLDYVSKRPLECNSTAKWSIK